MPEAPRLTALALGFCLIAAALSGALLERFGLPRVTGYLMFGMICGPYMLNIITRPMARELQLINGLAVVLIAFIAGLEMNVERMRPKLKAMMQLGGISMLSLYVGLFIAFWFGWSWLGLAVDVTPLQKVAIVAILTDGGGELFADGDDCAHHREPRQRAAERDDARGRDPGRPAADPGLYARRPVRPLRVWRHRGSRAVRQPVVGDLRIVRLWCGGRGAVCLLLALRRKGSRGRAGGRMRASSPASDRSCTSSRCSRRWRPGSSSRTSRRRAATC